MVIFMLLVLQVYSQNKRYRGGGADGFAAGSLLQTNTVSYSNKFTGGACDGFAKETLQQTNAVGYSDKFTGGTCDGFGKGTLLQANTVNYADKYTGGTCDGFGLGKLTQINAISFFNKYTGGAGDGFEQKSLAQGTLTAYMSGGTSPICHNTSPGTFTASGGGGNGSYAYQWFTTSGIVNGATNSTYTPGNLTATTGYYCAITSGSWGTVNTSTTTIAIGAATAITSQSTAAQTKFQNEPFDAIAVSATGTGTLTYQWFSNTSATNNSGTLLSGATNGNYTPQATILGTLFYYCTVHGNCGLDVTSSISGAFIVLPAIVTGNIGNGHDTCYSADQTITVAGGATIFIVEDGGSATMIAGQNIMYLPGTKVEPGGYLLGKIAPGGPFCGQQLPSIANVVASTDELPVVSQKSSFLLYPNPTTGKFRIEQKSEIKYCKVQVVVFGIHGEKLLARELSAESTHEFLLSGYPYGLCFVKIFADKYVETFKLVILK